MTFTEIGQRWVRPCCADTHVGAEPLPEVSSLPKMAWFAHSRYGFARGYVCDGYLRPVPRHLWPKSKVKWICVCRCTRMSPATESSPIADEIDDPFLQDDAF